jgi:RND family efflux transporter MFP subunit
MVRKIVLYGSFGLAAVATTVLSGCSGAQAAKAASAEPAALTVGVVKIGKKDLGRTLTVSSELVPFQEIDVFAKESGYVQKLYVDYGSRVKTGQLMAVLEIPELEAQLRQDDAAIKNAQDMVTHAGHELSRSEAQHKVDQLEFDRLDGVAKTKPGLVAQQEVDDAEGKALGSAAQVEAAKATLEASQSQLAAAQSKREHDQALFDYSKITAPFDGVVTQRYANYGTLMQAGTGSSTQVLPLVRLSQESLFRLVIPVPESYVRFIHIGDQVSVRVPALNRDFPGKVTRFSVDVKEDTRTMHTEVDVPNPDATLMPGLYAEATLTLDRKDDALAVPLQAVDKGDSGSTVMVVDGSGKIVQRKVTIGIQTDADAEVLEGLSEGDQVVVSDRAGLRVGEAVTPHLVQLVQYQGQKASGE